MPRQTRPTKYIKSTEISSFMWLSTIPFKDTPSTTITIEKKPITPIIKYQVPVNRVLNVIVISIALWLQPNLVGTIVLGSLVNYYINRLLKGPALPQRGE